MPCASPTINSRIAIQPVREVLDQILAERATERLQLSPGVDRAARILQQSLQSLQSRVDCGLVDAAGVLRDRRAGERRFEPQHVLAAHAQTGVWFWLER